MNPLAPPPTPRHVLSFDFDGSLHDPATDPPVDPAVFDCLRRLREDHGAVWGINTGRSIEHLAEGLEESGFPFAPDWVVAREREVWLPAPGARWTPHEPWMSRLEEEHRRFFVEVAATLEVIRREVEEHTGATWIVQQGEPAGLVARTEEEMEWIAARVMELAAGEPLLGWQRNSIWLRFGHRNYHKGSSLGEVARHFGVAPASCFAVGDSHNDLGMLHPDAAAMFACPANAVAEVRAHVAALGGYQATAAHAAGCLEALRHFFPA